MKPSKWLPGHRMPFYFLLLVLLLQLLPGLWLSPARAQSPGTGLAVGDPVPDVKIGHLFNYATPTARLSDFRGKLLVLEFWASWCGSCKAAMPKLDSLQRAFPGELQVLLVNAATTGDTQEKLQAYFERWRRPDGQPYALTSVVYDSALYNLFPNRLIPHLVWIDAEGRLLGQTTASDATPETVRRLLRGESPAFAHRKHDQLEYDPTLPLFYEGNGHRKLPTVRSQLSGEVAGLPSHVGLLRTDSTVRLLATNVSLVQLSMLAHHMPAGFSLKQVLFSKQARDLETGNVYEEHGDNLFCYELILPHARQDEARALMRQDLERHFGVQTTVEKRRTPCWVLERRKGMPLPLSGGGKHGNNFTEADKPEKRMQNQSAARLVDYLNNKLPNLPVVDNTRSTDKLDLQFRADPQDLAAFNAELAQYGLRLRKRTLPLDMLVIRRN